MRVGEIIPKERDILLSKGRSTLNITVANTGDRPIQIGSHYHFFEANRLLRFDREKSFRMRLDIPSGTSMRFEPGETRPVQLVELGGKKQVFGLNGLTCGVALSEALEKADEKGFLHKEEKA